MNELADKKEIIRQLKEKLLVMERFSAGAAGPEPDFGLEQVTAACPGGVFPSGEVHEFVSSTEGCAAAADGFISGVLSVYMRKGGVCLWISAGRRLFPPALKFFGIEPHNIIFIDVKRERDVLWTMEQGLKCNSLAAVVGESGAISFTESRRLQLAAGESRVTGFLHRRNPRGDNNLACVSRWKIRPLPGLLEEGLPGVGFPRWEVELEKIRNGRPGIWQLEWREGGFRHLPVRKQAVSEPGISKKRYYA